MNKLYAILLVSVVLLAALFPAFHIHENIAETCAQCDSFDQAIFVPAQLPHLFPLWSRAVAAYEFPLTLPQPRSAATADRAPPA